MLRGVAQHRSRGDGYRARLHEARVLLVFVPGLCRGREPLEVLEAVLPWIDVVQVRPKEPDHGLDPERPEGAPRAVTEARALCDWTRRVLELVRDRRGEVLVTVNDRVDVAAALAGEGCAGVHLGQEDCPVDVAREVLGDEPLIGLSTHSAAQVARAQGEPVDYLGFGPVLATATKGYRRGLGTEAVWVAAEASSLPVFAIGGLGPESVAELAPLGRRGRVAVGSALLSAPDPAASARALRELLLGGEG